MRSFQEGGGEGDKVTDRVGDRGEDNFKQTFFKTSEKVIPSRRRIKPITRKNYMKPIGQEVCAVIGQKV